MACLSCQCITKALVFASLPTNNRDSPSPSSPLSNATDSPSKPSIPISKTKTRHPKKQRHRQSKLQRQLNLIRIERAIGAGGYRDSEPRGSEKRDSILKGLLPNNASDTEGAVEKKLRETGEWLTEKTEGEFRSSGEKILMFFLKWVLPLYICMFLVTTGIIKLPFSTPQLDDLLM